MGKEERMQDIKTFVLDCFPDDSTSPKSGKKSKKKSKDKEKAKKVSDEGFADEKMAKMKDESPLIAVFEERPTLITFKVLPLLTLS